MLRTPSYPSVAKPCDLRLPMAALQYRLRNSPTLTDTRLLRAINVTAWLYRDRNGFEGIQVNPNTTIEELIRQFGPPDTPDAEWFRVRSGCQVSQIFSERIPCPKMCGPMLRTYFPGVPWYYYYDRRSWIVAGGN
jgi:hypothetical protein